ncbi:MAG: TIGR02147 family protein [Deltaproteobacteria bacterium]|nr:TIGR02147 family protein [Deltaproteobacteria bacterium]
MDTGIDIYDYTDYRKLLKDYYERKRAKTGRFSYRLFLRCAGFRATNFLSLVINGKRNLGMSSVQRFARVMGLAPREKLFFGSLVHLNQANTPLEIEEALNRLAEFREFREARKLDGELDIYFSQWYFPVVRELVRVEGFSERPAWISQKLAGLISADQAREALDTLQRIGLLKKNDAGKLELSDSHLTTDHEPKSSTLAQYHYKMMEYGQRQLRASPRQREISALTMSLSPEQFQEIRKRVRDFQSDIQKFLANNKNGRPAAVCQLNFQLFNFSTDGGEKR